MYRVLMEGSRGGRAKPWFFATVVSCLLSAAAPREFLIGFLPALSQNLGQTRYIVGAMTYAVQEINDDPNLLPGDHLNFTFLDNAADSKISIRHMIKDYCVLHVDAFIGPEDTCRTEALIAAAINLPMIAYKCRHSEVIKPDEGSFKEKYPTFARTLPSTAKVSKSVIALMQKYGWKSCTILQEDTDRWREAAHMMEQLADDHEIRINDKRVFSPPPEFLGEMENILRETYPYTRIFVFFGDYHAFLDFIRAMERQKINKKGDYLVIMVHEHPFDENKEYLWLKGVEYEDAQEGTLPAMRSVLMILPRNPTSKQYPDFLKQTMDLSLGEPFNQPAIPPEMAAIGVKIEIPIYAAYLYDAVKLYAVALNKTLSVHGNSRARDGRAIIENIRGKEYQSIQGHSVYLDEDGDSEANYTVVALKDDPLSPLGKSLKPVGRFELYNDGGTPSTVFHELEDHKVDWIGAGPPISDPACGMQGELCLFKPDWRTGVVCVAAACVILIATVVGCRHYLYEQKLARLLWKIDFKDILLVDPECDPAFSEKLKVCFQRKNYGRLSYLCSKDSKDSARSHSGFARVASYKGTLVAVKALKKRHVEVPRSVRKELQLMKEMSHDNVNRFVGACIDQPNACIVTHYCSRGSLKDILDNEDIHLDDVFIASLVSDLIKGMIYLHDSEIGSHGNLKSSNCLVDSRWVLQIADFGLHPFKVQETPNMDDDKYCQKLLYRAPEMLKAAYPLPRGTQKSDIYSFGLILYEIHGRAGPWGDTPYSPREIIQKVKCLPSSGESFRPDTSVLTCGDFVTRCMQECWHEEHDLRPDFKYTRIRLKAMQRGLRSNIFDNMLAIMEKYANNLEAIVDDRTLQLLEEKKKTESLLLRMLPRCVADQLKVGKEVVPELFQCVTIYFSDIVGFTTISAESTPLEVVTLLNDLYTLFDGIIEEYDVYKVETIGDAYMVVSGLPITNGDNHAGEIASMSLHLLRAIKHFRIRHKPNETLMLRIGIHSGPCVAGVVGSKMPRYCLFGDTVNTASRVESTGEALKIHCSKECKQILDKLGGYHLSERGYVKLKGRGEMFTYFLNDEDKRHRLRRISSASATTQERFPSTTGGATTDGSLSSVSDTDDVDGDADWGPKTVLLNGSARFARDVEAMELMPV